jgi:hypothetical protein
VSAIRLLGRKRLRELRPVGYTKPWRPGGNVR